MAREEWTPNGIIAGEHVRIRAEREETYSESYCSKVGVATSYSQGRWLVDYGAVPGGWGRYRVQADDLEHVELEAEGRPAMAGTDKSDAEQWAEARVTIRNIERENLRAARRASKKKPAPAPVQIMDTEPEQEPEQEQEPAGKQGPEERLAGIKERLGIAEPLSWVREEDIPVAALEIPGAEQVQRAAPGMARNFELVAMMHPPAVLEIGPGAYRIIAGRRRVLGAIRKNPDAIIKGCHVYVGLTEAQQALVTASEHTRGAGGGWVRDVEAIAELMDGGAQLTIDDLALILGRGRSGVAELARIAQLPEALRNQVLDGQLRQEAAKALTRVTPDALAHLSEQAAGGELVTSDDIRASLKAQWQPMGAQLIRFLEAGDEEEEQEEAPAPAPKAKRGKGTPDPLEMLQALSTDLSKPAQVRALANALRAALADLG